MGYSAWGFKESDRTERWSRHTRCLDVLGQRDGVRHSSGEGGGAAQVS